MFLLSSIGLNVARTIRTAASTNLINTSSNGSRMLSTSFVKYQTGGIPSSSSPSTTPPPSPTTASHVKDDATYKPTDMDKRYLVWSGKYKSASEIPEYIKPEAMERAHNKVRIRGANIMIVLTIIGCILMIVSGKNAAKTGASVQKQNLDWHKQYNQQPSTSQTESK